MAKMISLTEPSVFQQFPHNATSRINPLVTTLQNRMLFVSLLFERIQFNCVDAFRPMEKFHKIADTGVLARVFKVRWTTSWLEARRSNGLFVAVTWRK